MRTRQLIIGEGEENLRPHELRETVSLFTADGKPFVPGSGGSSDDVSKELAALKGRVTKLEKRIQELEE